MTARIIPVDPFDIVVFGATGDLAQRKLIPALFHRDEQGRQSVFRPWRSPFLDQFLDGCF